MSIFPDTHVIHYNKFKSEIENRLSDFKNVKPESYFYELCYCICTPQSKAVHANRVVQVLQERQFFEIGFNPEETLRDGSHYIRFHSQKALSLLKARENWYEIQLMITDTATDIKQKRDSLAKHVRGLGMKEASHFLRNIGMFGVAIIDRHVLKHLVLCGVFCEMPRLISKKDYLTIERQWFDYCYEIGIAQEIVDLLFWSYETGHVLK
ncbi:MAG TPA: hypothetical protein PLW09_00790 [Candidatus Kapabacteria bacterium]|nr:hypothetical protein [Candidatus Kapabacteria bacterium]